MSFVPPIKSKIKKLIFLVIFIVLFFIALSFVYPCLLWDISFLGHEIFFSFKSFGADKITSLKEIPECKDCNIILIFLDTLRADRLGCYGYKRNTSPNIDKFAKECIFFLNAFSNAYNTLPSHMSIFTSLYPQTHKINMIKEPILSSEFLTLAQILKKQGYQTIWSAHLNDSHLDLRQGFGKGFDIFYESIFSHGEKPTERLFSSILQNLNGKFFISTHSYINHAPYIYPSGFNERFSNPAYSGRLPKTKKKLIEKLFNAMKKKYKSHRKELLKTMAGITTKMTTELMESLQSNDKTAFSRSIEKLFGNPDFPTRYRDYEFFFDTIKKNISKDDVVELSNKYDNGVYCADYRFGQLIGQLEKNKLLDNTIIIVTAEHGEELFEHKGFNHGNFYDHTIHIPLMIRIPGMKRKIEVKKLVQSIDIIPMLFGIMGLEKPGYMQGKNILSNRIKNDFVYGFSYGDMYARSNKWKYMVNKEGVEELYYLAGDPGEKHNLIESKSIIVDKYRTKLKDELTKWKLRQF